MLAAAAAVLTVSGCAERGDFGRPKETPLSAFFMPVKGPTYSSFPFTDDEQELRNRSWRFLMPAKERSFFDTLIYDMSRVGFIDGAWFPESLTWYKEALLAEQIRSPASVFSRIANDTAADRALLAPFAASAARVSEADHLRVKAMRQTRALEEQDLFDANVRVSENSMLILWVCTRFSMRLASYRHALEHLFIAMPQIDAVLAERQLKLLEHDYGVLRPLNCLRPDPFRDVAVDRGLRMPVDGKYFSEEILAGPAWRSSNGGERRGDRVVRKDGIVRKD